jgi:death-on-curing protein
MRYLSLAEVLELHRVVIEHTGGAQGLRDLGALEAAVVQPRMAFGGQELYPSRVEKLAALGCPLIKNYPFVDGHKRVGHAAMETFLVLNGYGLRALVDEAERLILSVAAGTVSREDLVTGLGEHIIALSGGEAVGPAEPPLTAAGGLAGVCYSVVSHKSVVVIPPPLNAREAGAKPGLRLVR